MHPLSLCSSCPACLYFRLYIVHEQLSSGLDKGTEAHAHGSILMVAAMLVHGGKFMLPRFNETCVNVMRLKDHSSP